MKWLCLKSKHYISLFHFRQKLFAQLKMLESSSLFYSYSSLEQEAIFWFIQKSITATLFVCWQFFNSISDEKIVLAAESLAGYSVVFLVFVENIILIILLATRKQIQVRLIYQ